MTKGSWDIYIAFFEKGFQGLQEQGTLSFITPDKWISKPFGDQMRIATTNKIFSILKAGRRVFEGANVDAIVSVFLNISCPSLRIYEHTGRDINLKRIIPKQIIKPPYAYDWLFSNSIELLAKIETHKGRLLQLGVCENACATDDAYRLREFIEEEPARGSEKEWFRVVNTGTIGKYTPKWGEREMVYLGRRYRRPVVSKRRFLKAFPRSYGRKSVKKKVILKGLNLLDACLDSDGTVIPGIPTLLIPSDNLELLKLLLSMVNSRVAFFYIKEKYPGSSYNQGITFTKEMINNLPIPEISMDDKQRIVSLVDLILAEKDHDPQADTTAWEREIDRLVYDLYGLTQDEIALVEGSRKGRGASHR